MACLHEISDEEAMAGALTVLMARLREFSARSGLDLRTEILEDLTDDEWNEILRTEAFMRAGLDARKLLPCSEHADE